ncbi:MAG: hypothetical protein U0326_02595 [Polyangiales bacterium]
MTSATLAGDDHAGVGARRRRPRERDAALNREAQRELQALGGEAPREAVRVPRKK